VNKLPTPRDIERWSPRRWDDIAGNHELKATLQNFIRSGPCNLLVTGPKRTGKTRTIKHGIKALACPHRTEDLNPCNKCSLCRDVDCPLDGHLGLFVAATQSNFAFTQMDCEAVSREVLTTLACKMHWQDEGLIVYLDEISALGRRGMDTLLIKPIDEWPCIWFASAVTVLQPTPSRSRERVGGLSEAVRNRFAVKVGSTVPSMPELFDWVRVRCAEWQIEIDDEKRTLPELWERSQFKIGLLKQQFARAAATPGRRLTLSEVRAFNYEALD